jgi:hypothetical protein
MVTSYFILPRTSMALKWLLATPWTFVPFILVAGAIRVAQGVGRRAIVLVATLFVVGYGFSVYFDRRFVRLSSIDLSPLEVPFVQSLVAAVTWIAVRRRRRAKERT